MIGWEQRISNIFSVVIGMEKSEEVEAEKGEVVVQIWHLIVPNWCDLTTLIAAQQYNVT